MKEKKFKIAQTSDLLSIYRLFRKCFPNDELYKTSNPTTYWIAVNEKKKHCAFCILTFIKSENIGFMAMAGVIPEAQGMGLQLRMIRVREREARKLGCGRMITYTKIDNIASSRNLQKAGYQIYLPEYEYADEDCIYWIKDL